MTLKEAKLVCRELGLNLKKNEYGEYVLTGKHKNRKVEYFTDSIEDAVNTAIHVKQR